MTQRVEDHHLNGFPSWPQLFEIVTNIQTTMGGVHSRLGGLERGQDLAIEQARRGFDRMHNRVDNLRDRVRTLEEEAPKPTRKPLRDILGLSMKELIGLLILAAMGLAGTMEPGLLAAWLR